MSLCACACLPACLPSSLGACFNPLANFNSVWQTGRISKNTAVLRLQIDNKTEKDNFTTALRKRTLFLSIKGCTWDLAVGGKGFQFCLLIIQHLSRQSAGSRPGLQTTTVNINTNVSLFVYRLGTAEVWYHLIKQPFYNYRGITATSAAQTPNLSFASTEITSVTSVIWRNTP